MMNQKTIQAICSEIYRRFPEFKGTSPKVQLHPVPQSKAAVRPTTYLLTFRSRVTLGENRALPRLVRVVANDQGKILRISSSH
jgi:hypothetical protein